MKNVLMLKFPYSSTFGGGEIHTIGLIEGLMSRGFTFYYAGSCSVLLEQFKKRNWHTNKKYLGKEPVSLWGIVVFTLLSPLLFFYLAGILAYYRFAKNIRTVYCLSLGEKILGTPVIRLLGMKPVWVEHLLIERWLFQNPYRLFYVLWSNIASIVAVSGAVKRGLVELGVRESRTQVIYNSVDYDHFVPRVPPTETTIGYLGRFAPEKGLEDIVNAFGLAAKKNPALKLVMYGHGPNWEDIRDRIKKLDLDNRVTLHKWIDDQREAFKQFSVVIMPAYRRDSFGIVTVEAAASEIPGIVSDLPGFKEVVVDNETGKIYPRHDVERLAELMLDVAENPTTWEAYAKNARQRVINHFSVERMLNQYEELLG